MRNRKYVRRKVITTNDSQKREAFYNTTDADAPLDLDLYAVGVIEHPTTKVHQVWLSTNGLDLIFLSAQHDKSQAESDLQEIKTFIGSEDFYDEEKMATVIQKLKQGSDATPTALPDDLVDRK